ncbi:MAG: HAMP domain-containing histidine kinase, partial [Alphaproteobacteria bacterium]|nr:HAMP domain-containing histidine kinase [Alphaproteobacteria bacterium]
VVMLIMLLLLQRMIVGPLLDLTRHILSISRSGDLSQRLAPKRSDEIGTLAFEFDGMLDNLADARRRLLEQSYNSGLAEMAAGILHNVRNQLTPMVLRIGRLTSDLAAVPGANADQAIVELADKTTPADRREKLTRYMSLAIDEFAADRKNVANGLQEIAGGLGRMDEILAHHEEVSHAERVVESMRLSQIIEDAIKSLPDKPGQPSSIILDPEIDGLPSVRAERIVLLQVLENVLRNAAAATGPNGDGNGEIHLTAVADRQTGQEMIRLSVRDNGAGMDSDTLERIFERGFTTKPDGKGGLGLHWCANSMASMGGRIYAESDGLGQGATVHILIPAFGSSSMTHPSAQLESNNAAA